MSFLTAHGWGLVLLRRFSWAAAAASSITPQSFLSLGCLDGPVDGAMEDEGVRKHPARSE